MAGYRPKSLDELNSLYDKSLNAKNEIEKKASVLEEKEQEYVPVAKPIEEEPQPEQETSEETAGEEISGLVDDFIKSFGAPAPIKKVRPATVAATAVKSVSSAKSNEVKAPISGNAFAQQPVTAVERPKLIRNSERNDLFEDYKKVMDDEDDDEYSRHRRGRKRGKKLFEKKPAHQQEIYEEQEADAQQSLENAPVVSLEPETAEPSYEIAEGEMTAEAEIPETLENIDAVIEKVLGRPLENKADETVIQQEEDQASEAEIAETVPEVTKADEEPEAEEAVPQELYEEAEQEQEEEVKAPEETYEPEQPSFIPVYVAPLVEEEAEATEEAAENDEESDNDEAFEEEEHVEAPVRKRNGARNALLVLLFLVLLLATAVSAVKAFAGINSDSLVLDKFHLYTAQSSYEQAGINKGDLVVIAHEGIEEGDIFAFKKGDGDYGFAKLDTVLNEDSVVADNDGQKSIVFKNTLRGVLYKVYPAVGTFAALIASNYLYIVGALLLVAAILILVIAFAFRKKKVKKEDEPDEESEQEEELSDNSEYEAVEGDFRYLIQEEDDEYDVYRDGYSDASQDEGLPVYEDGDYKYEPDEYVTK